MLIIHDVTIFDGETLLDGPQSVVVRDGRIERVMPAAELPTSEVERARRERHFIQGSGAALIPGLIDLHVHLVWDGSDDPVRSLALESHDATLLKAVGFAQTSLRAGITTVRDLGSVDDLAIRVGEGVEAGWIQGPWVIASGRSLIMTGGHDPFWGLAVDGPDEALKGVRTQIAAGARVIKVSATGGVYGRPHGESVDDVELLPEELRAIVDQAHRRGVKVAAHAIGEQGIRNCVEAGIDTIEHGHFLTPELAREMAARGVALIPTLFVYQQIAESSAIPAYAREKARAIVERHQQALTWAREAGVRIGAGSDAGSPMTPHPALLDELDSLVNAGLSPTDALRAATSDAARILGLEHEIGFVREGHVADLALVAGEPWQATSHLRQPRAVIARGQRIVQRLDP